LRRPADALHTFHSTSIGVEPCPTVDRLVEHRPGALQDRGAGFDADVDALVVNAACALRGLLMLGIGALGASSAAYYRLCALKWGV